MTDWLEDLEVLVQLYQTIESKSGKEVYDVLLKFLIHAPEHVVRASELLTGLGIEDFQRRRRLGNLSIKTSCI